MQAVRRDSGDELGIVAEGYVEWVCRESRRRHGEPIGRVTVYRMYQPSPIAGTDEYENPSRIAMIEYDCAGGRPLEKRR
jgi:hypothetical protein